MGALSRTEVIADYVLPPSLQQWSRPTFNEQAISAVTQDDRDCDYHGGAAIVGRKDPCRIVLGEQGDRSTREK